MVKDIWCAFIRKSISWVDLIECELAPAGGLNERQSVCVRYLCLMQQTYQSFNVPGVSDGMQNHKCTVPEEKTRQA